MITLVIALGIALLVEMALILLFGLCGMDTPLAISLAAGFITSMAIIALSVFKAMS